MLSSNINVKNLTFTPYCGVEVCVWGGGDQDVITIQTSTMTRYRLQHLVSTGVCGWGSGCKCISLLQRACWYMRALPNNGNEHRRQKYRIKR